MVISRSSMAGISAKTPMKTMPLFLFAAAFAATLAVTWAKEKVKLDDFKLEDGSQFKNPLVLKVEPDGLRIEHSAGVCKVKFEDLPEELQKQFAFDRGQAEEFRQQQLAEKEAKAAAEHEARVNQILEQRREVQESDFERAREAFYSLVESNEYSYPQLDRQLKETAAIFKEAGRKDLASQIEADRKFLRERELVRPAETQRREREQLLTRIRDLENQIAVLKNRPADVQVVRDTEVVPWIVDRPVIIDRPVVQPVPCPPSSRPAPAPSRPSYIAPALPSPPEPARPAYTPAPSVPHATPSAPPSSGAQQQGAHLWRK